jgi:hypothetical protein
VSQASQQYLETYRRYNYTTPKSYLELISLYKTLLAQKRSELQAAKERLQNGVEKIAQASAQVCYVTAHLSNHHATLLCTFHKILGTVPVTMRGPYPQGLSGASTNCGLLLSSTSLLVCCASLLQVADLQTALKEEQIIVEEKKVQTDELIVSIGKEKAVVDEAVESGREDEEAASKLAEEVLAFQDECSRDLEAGVLCTCGVQD